MKSLTLVAVLFNLSLAQANELPAFCKEVAHMAAIELALEEFPGELQAATKVEFIGYSGYHQKLYRVTIPFKTVKATEIYEVKVFEFEDSSTLCEIEDLRRITKPLETK